MVAAIITIVQQAKIGGSWDITCGTPVLLPQVLLANSSFRRLRSCRRMGRVSSATRCPSSIQTLTITTV